MPYASLSDLPNSVTNNLPEHAQEIYKEAFNSAYDKYKDATHRKSDDSREDVAHKVAWSAVKRKYEKAASGKWYQKKPSNRYSMQGKS